MRTTLTALFVTGALLVGSAARATAADLCFLDSHGRVLVGKSFKLPAEGKCKVFNGYFSGMTTPVSGNACGTSATIYFNLNFSTYLGIEAGIYRGYLDRSAVSGLADLCEPAVPFFAGLCEYGLTIVKTSCSGVVFG